MLGKKMMSVFASTAIGLVWLAASATAQPTEYVYGPANTQDQAFRRVTPVVNCPGGGYISVGTLDQAGANPDVYVVRTNNAGAQLWEKAYDIQANQSFDEGAALAEMANGTGFVLLGNTVDAQGVWNISLIKVDCQGLVIWSQLYNDPNNLNLRGHDLIETVTGNAAAGTAAGDLAVAGYSFGPTGTNDAFLMRTNNFGALIWNMAYDNLVIGGAPTHEIFRALTEARPVAPQITGDLVAVGRYVSNANNNVQGLVARVSGDTGAIGAAPQCMAHHGGGSADVYNSVTQLQTPPFAGQFAIVGTTTNLPNWLDDIWVVRGNPCGIVAQTRIGNIGPITAEAALDVREVRGFAPANVGIGDLALTGYHGPGINGPFDAYLLFVRVVNLAPIFGNLFGDHLQANEIGFSLAQTPANGPQVQGFVVAGLSETDWDGLGDPRDLYQVITNAVGGTNCDQLWNPAANQINWQAVQLQPVLRSPALVNAQQTPFWPLFTPFQVCF